MLVRINDTVNDTNKSLSEARDEPRSVALRCLVMTEGSPQKGNLVGGLYRPASAKETPKVPVRGATKNGQSVWTELSFFGQLFPVSSVIS